MDARRDDEPGQHLCQERRRVVGFEQALERQDLPQADARRVQIARARRFSLELLGRHVRELPFDLPIARLLQSPLGLGDPEVEHARDAVDADEDVLR